MQWKCNVWEQADAKAFDSSVATFCIMEQRAFHNVDKYNTAKNVIADALLQLVANAFGHDSRQGTGFYIA